MNWYQEVWDWTHAETSCFQELEVALDHANRANADAQKTIKRYQEQIRELQMQVEDEQRQKDDLS